MDYVTPDRERIGIGIVWGIDCTAKYWRNTWHIFTGPYSPRSHESEDRAVIVEFENAMNHDPMSMTHEPEAPDAAEPTTDCTALQTRRDSRRMRMIHVRCAESGSDLCPVQTHHPIFFIFNFIFCARAQPHAAEYERRASRVLDPNRRHARRHTTRTRERAGHVSESDLQTTQHRTQLRPDDPCGSRRTRVRLVRCSPCKACRKDAIYFPHTCWARPYQ
jgi:hypothetical protein